MSKNDTNPNIFSCDCSGRQIFATPIPNIPQIQGNICPFGFLALVENLSALIFLYTIITSQIKLIAKITISIIDNLQFVPVYTVEILYAALFKTTETYNHVPPSHINLDIGAFLCLIIKYIKRALIAIFTRIIGINHDTYRASKKLTISPKIHTIIMCFIH